MAAVIVLTYLVLMVTLNFAYYRFVPRETRLQDLGHELIPELPYVYVPWVDLPLNALYFVTALVVLASLRACVSFKGFLAKPPYIVNMVRRFGTLYASGHVLRALSYLSTSVPGGATRCMDLQAMEQGRPSFLECFYRTASVETNCGDLMFSGHLLLCALIVCMTMRYAQPSLGISPANARLLVGLTVVLTMVQSVLIIAARRHYTSDVLVALYVTPMLFYWHDTFAPNDLEPDHVRIASAIRHHPEWWNALNPFPDGDDDTERS
jgi:hypothetical protein